MRYYCDTEYDGFGGTLLSIALVPDDGGEEFYAVIAPAVAQDDWVQRHVIPYLDTVPDALRDPPLDRAEAARALTHYLGADAEPEIVADWPEDLAQFAMLFVTGPGEMVAAPPFILRLVNLSGFSTAANSAVPHNALHDARALRDHVENHLA